jgi:hypothetical protein
VNEAEVERREREIENLKIQVGYLQMKIEAYSLLPLDHPANVATYQLLREKMDRLWELTISLDVFFETGLIIE